MIPPMELITTIVVIGGFILVVYSGFTKRPVGECLKQIKELILGFINGLDGEE